MLSKRLLKTRVSGGMRRGEHGIALLEFSLAGILFLGVLVGILQYGYISIKRSQLRLALDQAAHAAAKQTVNCGQAAESELAQLGLAMGGNSIVRSLTGVVEQILSLQGLTTEVLSLQMKAAVPCPLCPLMLQGQGGSFPIVVSAVSPVEVQGACSDFELGSDY
jgi:uncharacterized membrane protein